MRIRRYQFAVFILLSAATRLAADDLPEYETENTATSLRPPISQRDGRIGVLRSIARTDIEDLVAISCTEVTQITALQGQTLRVHGTVSSSYVPQGGSPVLLNFGDDFRNCFKVVVFRRNYDHWEQTAAEIAALYEGQEILVEGTVSLYQELPQIEVMSPAQLHRIVDE